MVFPDRSCAFPVPRQKFPAPEKKFPAQISREFGEKTLVYPRLFGPTQGLESSPEIDNSLFFPAGAGNLDSREWFAADWVIRH